MAVIYKVTTTASPLVRYVSRPTKTDKKARIVQCSKNVLYVNRKAKKSYSRSVNDIVGFNEMRDNFIDAHISTFTVKVYKYPETWGCFEDFQLKIRGLNRRAVYELSVKLANSAKTDHCSDSDKSL